MTRKIFRLFLILILALSFSPAVFAQGTGLQVPESAVDKISQAKGDTSVYLVLMSSDPVLAYEGDIAGLPATRPGQGEKVDQNSAHVRGYVDHLESRHNEALDAAGVDRGRKLYDYSFAVNGFAARLTAAEAAALSRQPEVLIVTPDVRRYIQTENSPSFLGLTDPSGPWATGVTGEGVVVGVIDTGIWPEHPSFADDGSYGRPPRDFTGTGCDFGNRSFNPDDARFRCNRKLLAAKSYGDGFHGGTGEGLAPGSYLSARDEDGHGTHTTSTAAGNAGVNASIFGIDRGVVSGIAPRAHISVYKACWSETPEVGGCNFSDLAAAIDQAVADGVDVINYSIGGGASLTGPDEIAFLFAADAGVYVATSAGNDGPGAATVGSPGVTPWITAVGASTQNRTFQGSVSLGDGSQYFGASVTPGTDVLPLVDAEDAGDNLCTPGALDPAVVAGKIVLCERGVIARVSKSQAVSIAGGLGMVLFNVNDAQETVTDNHYVPSVHINNTDGMAIKAYIDSAGSGATAQIFGGVSTPIDAPWMADFSSRGPNPVATDIIKPDVTAPGVNILAGNSPTALLGAPGQLFQSISGTSMSSPHVAGVFALLKQAHPDWSPAAAKSALMTTAYQDVLKEGGSAPADPFDMGAGHINPGGPWTAGSLTDPGLVYDAGFNDYLAFLCGAAPEVFGDPAATCSALEAAGFSLDPSDLNLASIGIGELVGTQTITRTVTSVATAGRAQVYDISVEAPPGFDITVSPSSLRLRSGQSATYTVTVTNNGAATTGEWAFGSLTWEDRSGNYSVRSPIALRAFQIDAPAEVSGTGTSGSLNFDVKFGYDGDYSAAPHGLIPAEKQPGNVVDDPANDINIALSTGVGVTFHEFTIPDGTVHARFSLFDEFTDGEDDLDLYVFGPDTADFPFVGGSGTATSAEQVDLAFPEPGLYLVVVHGWQTDGPDANYTLFGWAVGPDAGNMTVSGPTTATLNETATIEVSWSGLASGEKYLGAVSHSDASGILDLTLVNINTE